MSEETTTQEPTSKKLNKFSQILMRDNKSIQQARAERIGSITANALESKRFVLEKEIAEIDDKLERQLDLSTSNVSTSINRIENWDADSFISDRANWLEQKFKAEMRVKFINQIKSDLFE